MPAMMLLIIFYNKLNILYIKLIIVTLRVDCSNGIAQLHEIEALNKLQSILTDCNSAVNC